jgi:predicted metalloprotease with PDZ domain
VSAQTVAPIVYRVRMSAPDTHDVKVADTIPADRRPSIEMMMAVWSFGYNRIEDYAARVDEVKAGTQDGAPLTVEKTVKNRWQTQTSV